MSVVTETRVSRKQDNLPYQSFDFLHFALVRTNVL